MDKKIKSTTISTLYPGKDYFFDPAFPLFIKMGEERLDNIHHHNFHELVVVLDGTAIHCYEGNAYAIRTGDVFLIKPETPHSYNNFNHLLIANVLFMPDKLSINMLDLKNIHGYHALFELEPMVRDQHKFKSRLHLSVRSLTTVKQILKELESELIVQNPGWQFMSLTVFQKLVVFLSRCYERQSSVKTNSLLRLSGVITYMEKHYSEPLNLQKLAARASMSPRHFNRQFKQTTGFSAIDYLIRIKIEKAASLLASRKHNITEAALAVGITNSSYFSRQFKKIMGMSPRSFAKKQ